MNEKDEVGMKEAADNVILLDEAVFERIVGVLVHVLTTNEYPTERKKILGAIDYARQREMQEMQEGYMRQQAAMEYQKTKMWVSSNTGAALQNTNTHILNPYSNTASIQSIQDQLNYQQSRLEVERARAQLEAAQADQQRTIFDKLKFW